VGPFSLTRPDPPAYIHMYRGGSRNLRNGLNFSISSHLFLFTFTSLFSLPTFLVFFSVNVVSSFPFHASSLWRETAQSWPKIAILAYLGNRKGIWWERFRFFLCSYFPQICHLEQYVRQAVLSRPQLLTSLIQRKTRSQAVARIADRTAKNCKDHVT